MLSWNPWKYSFYAFSVTQPVRGNAHAPVRGFHGNPGAHKAGTNRSGFFNCAHNSTFPAKINDLWPITPPSRAPAGSQPRVRVKTARGRRPPNGRAWRYRRDSVARAGFRRKIFLEFAFHAFEILGVGRGFLLLGDIGPALGI